MFSMIIYLMLALVCVIAGFWFAQRTIGIIGGVVVFALESSLVHSQSFQQGTQVCKLHLVKST